MKWQYIKAHRRLNVYGTDSERDVLQVKKLIEEKKIPNDLDAIVYRKSPTSQTSMIIRGVYLANLLTPEQAEPAPRVIRPGIKTILRSINQDNVRQGMYAGVVFYSISTKRFMLFAARGRNQPCMFLGDYQAIENETPIQIVCRVAVEDTQFEIDPKWLIPLQTVEENETTFHSFMVLVEKEFKPELSGRYANSMWEAAEALTGLHRHAGVKAVFEQDPYLKRLTQPEEVDFDAIIEEILQTQRQKDAQ